MHSLSQQKNQIACKSHRTNQYQFNQTYIEVFNFFTKKFLGNDFGLQIDSNIEL